MCENCIKAFNELPIQVHEVYSEKNINTLKDMLRAVEADVNTTEDVIWEPGTTEETKQKFADELTQFKGAHSLFALLGYYAATGPFVAVQIEQLLQSFEQGSQYAALQQAAKEAAPLN